MPPGRAEVSARDQALRWRSLPGRGLRSRTAGEAAAPAPRSCSCSRLRLDAHVGNQVMAFTSVGYRFIAYDRRRRRRGRRSRGARAATRPRALPPRRHRRRRHRRGRLRAELPAAPASLVVANSIVGVQDEEYIDMSRRLRPRRVQRPAGRDARAARACIPRRQPRRHEALEEVAQHGAARRPATASPGPRCRPSRRRPCSSPATPTSTPRPGASPLRRAFPTANRRSSKNAAARPSGSSPKPSIRRCSTSLLKTLIQGQGPNSFRVRGRVELLRGPAARPRPTLGARTRF